MKRPWLLATGMLMLAAPGAQAVPIPCPATTTLASLMAMAPDGCFVQDKVFTGFAYSPGAADATLVDATLSYQVGAGPDVHGWTFARQGSWTSGFTLSYTVSVAPGTSGVTITGAKDQINTGLVPSATTVTDTQSATVLTPTGFSLAAETAQATFTGVSSTTTTCVVTIPSGSLLVKLSQQFFETTAE